VAYLEFTKGCQGGLGDGSPQWGQGQSPGKGSGAEGEAFC